MTKQTTEPVEPRVVTTEDLGRPAWASEDRATYDIDDAMGWAYAFGRLDQGHPPVAIIAPDRAPSSTGTAWLFGRMWAALKREERDPNVGGYFPGIQSAWDNFAASGGRTLRRR